MKTPFITALAIALCVFSVRFGLSLGTRFVVRSAMDRAIHSGLRLRHHPFGFGHGYGLHIGL